MENKAEFQIKDLIFVKLTTSQGFLKLLGLIPVPFPKLKDLLDTKIDPVQGTIRSGVYIKPFKKYNKEFLYLGIKMRKFCNRIKEPEADRRLKRPRPSQQD